MSPFPDKACSGEAVVGTDIDAEPTETGFAGKATAISPGRITRKGKSILGIAAISGVRRAAVMESAAMARCTTRKSVHQYPKDKTKPNPIANPNHSTPMGLWAGESINSQEWVHAPAG